MIKITNYYHEKKYNVLLQNTSREQVQLILKSKQIISLPPGSYAKAFRTPGTRDEFTRCRVIRPSHSFIRPPQGAAE